MHQHQLVVLLAETQHAKAQHERECARGDQRAVAVLVEQRAGKAGRAEREEGLDRDDP